MKWQTPDTLPTKNKGKKKKLSIKKPLLILSKIDRKVEAEVERNLTGLS